MPALFFTTLHYLRSSKSAVLLVVYNRPGSELDARDLQCEILCFLNINNGTSLAIIDLRVISLSLCAKPISASDQGGGEEWGEVGNSGAKSRSSGATVNASSALAKGAFERLGEPGHHLL